MKSTRLEAFSDGVIAIIITIMVLELKVPQDTSLAGVLRVWPVLSSYILSFVIVAIYWVNHHHLIHLAHKVDASILWANINLLFWMSLMPWVTAFLGSSHATPMSVALYGGVSLLCCLAFLILRLTIARHHGDNAELARLHARRVRRNLLASGLYLASIPAAFVDVPVALALLVLPPLMYFIPDRAEASSSE
jgi:uncharacterized membrane protein